MEQTLVEMREVFRLIVRHCWQAEDNSLQEAICRTFLQTTTHFEDCAFVTRRLQKNLGPTLLSLHGKQRDICTKRHIKSPASGFDEVIESLHCDTCFDFDICIDCHRSDYICLGEHELYSRKWTEWR